MTLLGVNIDHIATVRQARKISEPDPVFAAALAELGGADNITVHLRQDRRHIQDRDVRILRETVKVRLNLEMSLESEIVRIAAQTKPHNVCIVPENRQEVTTEGGLKVTVQGKRLKDAIRRLSQVGSVVSLFIDPDPEQIDAAARSGASHIELHTGAYAEAFTAATGPGASKRGAQKNLEHELTRLLEGTQAARSAGLHVNAGHGLNYKNVGPVAAIAGIEELNIGHSIVSRALIVGLTEAVREMKALIA
ncbi:MAG TPA: pyridoxine 5'-phosphate synthase [Planctomycetota bacterium]|nr:pyridoxine 5'-phosphate synthase [Planctomycetota bacterium]